MTWTDWVRRSALVFCDGLTIRQAAYETGRFLGVSTNSNNNAPRTLLNIGHKIKKRDLDERTRKDIASLLIGSSGLWGLWLTS
jgi:hypothetical protein